MSLRDEAVGVSGHLMSWSLSLNSQVVVETFDRGLDISDPVERESENIWFSADGRYAVARALQSDSARVWDLAYARAARTIAVPAAERVLGLTANASSLVTSTLTTVNLWRTADGVRATTLEFDGFLNDAAVSDDGRSLLVVSQSEADTIFEVWSLDQAERLARLAIAGVPALYAVNADATRLAVADYDRAVRVWDLAEGELIAQVGLQAQPDRIALSPNGNSVGILASTFGVSVWDVNAPEQAIFSETGDDNWYFSFSPSGAQFLAGNGREGLQAYRSIDGVPVGPLIDGGVSTSGQALAGFSADESLVATIGSDGRARLWRLSGTAASAGPGTATRSAAVQGAANIVAAVSRDGRRVAFGDTSGHVHIEAVGETSAAIAAEDDDVSFVGHGGAVRTLVFSADGTVVASAADDGSIRIWDASSGLPRPHYARAPLASTEYMAFSADAGHLAVLGGQRLWIMDTATGRELASIEVGNLHFGLEAGDGPRFFLAGADGALRTAYADPTGSWHLSTVWQGTSGLRWMAVAPTRGRVAVIDQNLEARLLDIDDGSVGAATVQLPAPLEEVSWSPNESRLLFRTGRWIHRALVTPSGLMWSDSVRAPKSVAGATIAYEHGTGEALSSGDTVLILARDTGAVGFQSLQFGYRSGDSLIGRRGDLLRTWTERLNGLPVNEFVREGF